MVDKESDPRDAHYETHAVVEHYFKHPNVAPFMSYYFIQRFGVSNPSPQYIESVSYAFKDGIFTYNDGSNPPITFGTGKYGDLGATIAAVTLNREARSIVLDYDPSKGHMKEPLLKVISVMRAMEYEPFENYGFENLVPNGTGPKRFKNRGHRLYQMTEKTGQQVYYYPDIFSFFRREYSPLGPVKRASLVGKDTSYLFLEENLFH